MMGESPPPATWILVLMFIGIGGRGVIASYFLCQRMHTRTSTHRHTDQYMHTHTHTHTHTHKIPLCLLYFLVGWRMVMWGMVVKRQYTTHTYERERGREWGRREMGGDLSEIDSRHRHSQFINLPFFISFSSTIYYNPFISSYLYIYTYLFL